MELIIFMICSISIFFINDIRLLIILLILNFFISIILKINIKNTLNNLKFLLPFIIFTALINLAIDGIYSGIIIFLRLLICYNITYIFSNLVTVAQISESVKWLCNPLKLFRVDIEKIGTIVSIALCMVPILKDELNSLIKSMKSKGRMLTIGSFGTIMKPMLISVLNRTNEIEKALINKGYQ